MDYTNLGSSGLKVSRIALGCMSFGTPREVMPWTLDEDAAQPIFRQALDLGITFWDTANVYGSGASEEIVGRALKQLTTREAIVLATKVCWPMHAGPGGSSTPTCERDEHQRHPPQHRPVARLPGALGDQVRCCEARRMNRPADREVGR